MALNLGPLNVMLRLQGAQQFTRQTRNAESALVGFGKAVGGTLVLHQLTRQMIEATKVFAEFERAMVRVGAVTNSLGTEAFAGLTERAKDLATTTEFTARQVADAMGFMGMAGMDVNKIYESTPAVLQLASAGMVDVASAADTVTNIMAGYGIEAKDLTKANNVLVATFTGSNTSLQSLGQSFKYAGSVAKNAGVEFREAAAVIGLMGNAGIQADMAGTALRGAIIKLLKPTDEGAEIMRRYGIEVKDSTGKLKSMVEIFRELEPIADDSALMVDLFGLRAGPGLQAALSQGSGALEKLIDKIDNAGNIAERIAQAQLDTLDGKIKIMKSAFEGLQIAVGEALGPATEKMVKNMTIIFNDLTDAIDGVGVGLLDSGFWSEAISMIKSFALTVAATIDTVATGVVRIAMLPLTMIQRVIAETQWMLGSMMMAFKNIPGMKGVFEAGLAMRTTGVSQRENLKQLSADLAESKPLENALQTFFDTFAREPTAKKKMRPQGATTTGNKVTAPVVDISGVGGRVPLFNDRLFGDAISPLKRSAEEVEQAQKGLAEAAARTADRLEQAGALIYQVGSAVVSGNIGSTFGPMLLGRIGSIVSQNLGDPTGATGAAIGSILGELFGSAFDELINSLGVLTPLFEIVADILKAFSAPLIVLKAMFETLRDAVGIGFIPILEMMASVMAKYLYQQLLSLQVLMPWVGVILNIANLMIYSLVPALDLLFSAATFLNEQAMIPLARGSIMAYNALADFVNGLITALREFEVAGAKPFESFGVLMSKLDPDTVQTYLDLISDENEARSEAAQGLREFSEELRNVPIGVKRIRGLQFSATAGRFNSPAWGA